jgi:hypothetical protein
MKQYKQKFCLNTKEWIFAALGIISLFISSFSKDIPSIYNNGYLFSAVELKNSYWKNMADSMAISIPNNLNLNKPLRFIIVDSSNGYLVNADGAVSKVAIAYKPFISPCVKASLEIDSTFVSTDLVIPNYSQCSAIKLNDKVYFAYLITPMQITVVQLASDGKIVKNDTVNCANISGNKKITSIKGFSDAFWVGGNNGIIRQIPILSTGVGNETVFDITTTDSLLFVNNAKAILSDGSIYLKSGNQFQLSKSLAFSANFANENIIMGTANTAVLNGTNWDTYKKGSNNIILANVAKNTRNGTILEFVDNQWMYNTLILADSLTSISDIKPVAYRNFKNKDSIDINKLKDTLIIRLADPDSNYQLPEVTFKSGTIISSIFDNNTGTRYFGKFIDYPCTTNVIKLNADSVKLYIAAGTICLEFTSLIGRVNTICSGYKWVNGTTVVSKPILYGSSIIFKVGQDSISLYGNNTAIASKKLPDNLNLNVIHNGSHLVFNRKKMDRNNYTITLWSLNGQLLYRTEMSENVITSDLVLAKYNQMTILRIQSSNNVVLEQKILPFGK